MKDYSKYWKALTFAAEGHGITLRKGKKTPYLVHPLRIASILRAAGFSEHDHEDLMIATLFHDLVEDTSIPIKKIENEFGEKVASIVMELTKPDNGKKDDWLRSFNNASNEAKIIKMADRIDNLMDMNSNFWSTEKKKSYAEQGNIILEKCGNAHSELALTLKRVIDEILGSF